jgi:hypothetical protein
MPAGKIDQHRAVMVTAALREIIKHQGPSPGRPVDPAAHG